MTEVMNEGYLVQILDVDQNKNTAQQYNVRSVPTTVIEENGVEVDRFVGGKPKQQVIEILNG
jgi:thioredoxin 1